jgi:hypothetical protein
MKKNKPKKTQILTDLDKIRRIFHILEKNIAK